MASSVSIVIPCYNYAAYLPEAIDSALNQTYQCFIKVIDDGSSDDTAEVARHYESHPRVRVTIQDNLGPERTCNIAIGECDTDYFVRLDADDRLASEYVELLLRACQTRNAHFAYCDMEYFGAQDGMFRAKPFCVWSLMQRNYINASALTQVAAFLSVGGYDELERGDPQIGSDDWKLYLRLCEHGYRGVHVPRPLLAYRRHASGSRQQENPQALPLMRQAVHVCHAGLYRNIRYRLIARSPLRRSLEHITETAGPRWLGLLDKSIFGRGIRSAR